MDRVSVRFYDMIVTPWRELVDLLVSHPLAVNPDSNKLTVAANALAISLRHFNEQHPATPAETVEVSKDLKNWADSAKHASLSGRKLGKRDLSEETVTSHVSVLYEHLDGSFRFIRNDIVCSYPLATSVNAGREFSALDELWHAIATYGAVLGLDVRRFAIRESTYGFLKVAIAFNLDGYAAFTPSSRIRFFSRTSAGYEPVDPPTVKFAVFGREHLESDLTNFDLPDSNP